MVSLGGSKTDFPLEGEDGKFDMVKVKMAERDQYETHADIRLYAGMVSCVIWVHSSILTRYSPGSSTDLGDGSVSCVPLS